MYHSLSFLKISPKYMGVLSESKGKVEGVQIITAEFPSASMGHLLMCLKGFVLFIFEIEITSP